MIHCQLQPSHSQVAMASWILAVQVFTGFLGTWSSMGLLKDWHVPQELCDLKTWACWQRLRDVWKTCGMGGFVADLHLKIVSRGRLFLRAWWCLYSCLEDLKRSCPQCILQSETSQGIDSCDFPKPPYLKSVCFLFFFLNHVTKMEAQMWSRPKKVEQVSGVLKQMQEMERIGLWLQKMSSSSVLHECLKCEHAHARVCIK